MTIKLETRGLGKRYGDAQALEPTDLQVRAGEFLTLLGPSGSGKTTLLQMIAGLTEPSAGQLYIDGVEATNLPPGKRGIGLVFQSYALFPHMTVAENVAYPLRMRRMRGQEMQRAVTDALAMVKMDAYAQRYPHELSGGQQQRIALARCFVYRPAVVLLDEPLGALDKKLREHMQLEIRRLHQELGLTFIYVTHDQEEALTMADRIVVMNGGRIEQIGTPDEIYAMPQSRFVAEFVGRASWFTGKVEGHGVVRVGDTQLAVPHLPPLPAGRAVELFVRPEAIALHARWQGGQNMVLAHLAGVESLGGFCRVSLSVPAMGNLALIADVSRTELATLNLQPGQMVPVTLPQAGLRFFLDASRAGVAV